MRDGREGRDLSKKMRIGLAAGPDGEGPLPWKESCSDLILLRRTKVPNKMEIFLMGPVTLVLNMLQV
jgi:hypothetical protein